MRHTYEVEVKSLLGSKEAAQALKKRMRQKNPRMKFMGKGTQLNHYFTGGALEALYRGVKEIIPKEMQEKLRDIIAKQKDFSVRTRLASGKVFLVVKAVVDDTTSANGTARIEIEAEVRISIEELDALVLQSGFTYQAKWSREREEYEFLDIHVTIDKNAGYGYMAEFEIMEENLEHIEAAKTRLRSILKALGIEELDAARLERMFAFYNEHWQDYYGTEKTFVLP